MSDEDRFATAVLCWAAVLIVVGVVACLYLAIAVDAAFLYALPVAAIGPIVGAGWLIIVDEDPQP